MKKISFVIFLFVFFIQILSAQTTINGKVTDVNNNPLSFSIVSLLGADGSVAAYASSNENGDYLFKTSKTGTFRLQAQSMSYAAQEKTLALTAAEQTLTVNFTLQEQSIKIDEAKVSAYHNGMQVKGDTIKYYVENFKDGSERVLGDVLNKLPGVSVNEQGKVSAYGKDVDKILFNGHDAYNGAASLAVKNVTADIAENVEVIKNYSEYSLLEGFESKEQTAINVGVKKSFLGRISGDVTAAGGFNDKYLARANLMQILPKSMVSFIGATNNIGESVLDDENFIKMRGGIKETIGGRENDNNKMSFSQTSDADKILLPQSDNVYKRANGVAAINFAAQASKKVKLNSYILYNRQKEENKNLNNETYILPTGNIVNSESKTGNSANNLFSGYVKLKYDPTRTTNINYSGVFSKSKMNRHLDATRTMGANTNKIYENEINKNTNTTQNLSLLHRIHKHLLVVNAQYLFDETPTTYKMQADTMFVPVPINKYNSWYFGKQKTNDKQIAAMIDAVFNYKINRKYVFKIGVNSAYNNNTWNSRLYSDAPNASTLLTADSLTNNNSSKLFHNAIYLRLKKQKGFFQYEIGLSGDLYNYKYCYGKSVSNRKYMLMPSANVTLNFSKMNILGLTLNAENMFAPISAYTNGLYLSNYANYNRTNDINKFYNLKYSAGLYYFYFDLFSNTMLMAGTTYTKNKYDLGNDYASNGYATENKNITAPDSHSLMAMLFLMKTFSFIPFSVQGNVTYMQNTSFAQIYHLDNSMEINTIIGNININSRLGGWFDFDLTSELDYMTNKSSFTNVTIRQITPIYGIALKANFKKISAKISGKHKTTKISGINKDIFMLGTSLRYYINDKFEISVTGENILHLNNQEWASISYNGVNRSEKYYYQIPGNLLLNLSYKF